MVKSIIGIAFDCPDANHLADFYVKLLDLPKTISSPDWAGIHLPQGLVLVFQSVENYVPPVWPWQDGAQQQMAHIDFYVEDLAASVDLALQYGATLAQVQHYDTSTVLLDPAGHPFCLSTVNQA